MPAVRVLRRRGVTTVVEANAEILFAPTGSISVWLRRLSNAVREGTKDAAPVNKRPRWAHYGPPLKKTFSATSRAVGLRAWAAIGSSATYSSYVDQGTGEYVGHSAWEAKILPPWQPGSPTLYESTWHPPIRSATGNNITGARNKPVMITGQEGQFFFDKGLAAGFAAMRLVSTTVPDAAVAGKTRAMPGEMLARVLGNNTDPILFRGELERWRTWRDRAWAAGRALDRSGEGGRVGATRMRSGRIKKPKVNRARTDGPTAAELAAIRRRRASEALAKEKKDKAKALKALKDAAERRKVQQRATLAKQRAAEKAKKEREEAESKARRERNALRAGNEKNRRAANAYFQKIKQAYPNAKFLQTTLGDGAKFYRVSWTDSGGQNHKQEWAYGYTD